MKYQEKYGEFSKAYWYDRFDGKYEFLSQPESLSLDAMISFASALWLYITPLYSMPSVHDVVIGKFIDNASDNSNGVYAAKWGTTTNILTHQTVRGIYKSSSCGDGGASESAGATARGEYYKQIMTDLNYPLANPSEDLGCKDMLQPWADGGGNQIDQYW